jgi:hypothetical protein
MPPGGLSGDGIERRLPMLFPAVPTTELRRTVALNEIRISLLGQEIVDPCQSRCPCSFDMPRRRAAREHAGFTAVLQVCGDPERIDTTR